MLSQGAGSVLQAKQQPGPQLIMSSILPWVLSVGAALGAALAAREGAAAPRAEEGTRTSR